MLAEKDFKRLVDGVMEFIVLLGGLQLYTYQYVFARRIVESVINNEGHTITGLWSRQTGKTTTVAITAIGLAVILPQMAKAMPHIEEIQPFKDGFWVGIFAPVKAQAELSYNRIRKIAHSMRGMEILSDPELEITIDSSRGDSLSLSNGSYVHAKTASPDSQIEGATYHVVICDESQKLDRFKVEKEIEPMLSSTNGSLVKIGTAWISRGGFHSDIQKNLEEFKRKLAPRNHFEFPYDVVLQERRAAFERDGNVQHLNYEKYVQRYIRRRGKNSLAFRMNFMLKWQESNLDVFSSACLLDAQDPSRHLNRYFPVDWTRVAGIDVGKENDPTVITVNEVDFEHPIKIKDEASGEEVEFYPKIFVAMRELEGRFEDYGGDKGQYSNAIDFLREWDVRRCVIDSTSIGSAVYERLEKLTPEIEWEPFTFNAPSKHNLYRTYIDEMESGRQKIAASKETKELMEWQKWEEEHRNLEKHQSGSYMNCRAPEPESRSSRVIETESEYHDDYPDSSALACWAARASAISEAEVVDRGGSRSYSNGRSSGRSLHARYGRRR
jgi:hypothetical protein